MTHRFLKKTLLAVLGLTLIATIIYFNFKNDDFQKPLEYHSDGNSRKVIDVKIQMAFTSDVLEFKAEVVDSLVIIEGDVILGTLEDFELQALAAVTGKGKLWENGIIPYKVQSNHPNKDEILKAIKEINDKTNINLKPRLNEIDYVSFSNKPNCASYVGKQGKAQVIECGNCTYGSIIHEILHAAGFYHEHTRKDRNEYITINKENIEDGSYDNFKCYIDRYLSGNDIKTYDYNSIMHYDEFSFSKNGNKTIIVKTKSNDSTIKIGQRNGLSEGDIIGINLTYPLKK